MADYLVRRSVWIVGGDGWAYDIGSGGLDHVLASGRNVNVLVLDTEVYSNTGGQASKATPLGAVAKFAASGKTMPKKDLALQAIAYGYVYVARVAMGADPQQTLRAFREAEAYDGPSLIIAYSHCIAHGIEMRDGLDQQYRAVASGYWPLIRYDPVLREAGANPFLLDSPRPRIPLADYTQRELRYRALGNTDPAEAERLAVLAQQAVDQRWDTYEEMASRGPAQFPADARQAGPPGRRSGPPTPTRRTDGPVHPVPGPGAAQPAGRLGVPAVEHRRRRPAAGRRRRRRGRAVLPVRGAAAARGGARTRRWPTPGPRASPSRCPTSRRPPTSTPARAAT